MSEKFHKNLLAAKAKNEFKKMLPCSECAKLLKCQNDLSMSFKNYPLWYQQGKQCPVCGAGYVGEFGTRFIEK